jgi:hypothetical protein
MKKCNCWHRENKKLKVKVTLQQATKAQWWSRVIIIIIIIIIMFINCNWVYTRWQWLIPGGSTLSLTSALYRVGWSTPRLGSLTPEKEPMPI